MADGTARSRPFGHGTGNLLPAPPGPRTWADLVMKRVPRRRPFRLPGEYTESAAGRPCGQGVGHPERPCLECLRISECSGGRLSRRSLATGLRPDSSGQETGMVTGRIDSRGGKCGRLRHGRTQGSASCRRAPSRASDRNAGAFRYVPEGRSLRSGDRQGRRSEALCAQDRHPQQADLESGYVAPSA